MATVQVNFGTAMGAGAPAFPPAVNAGQAITSSGTSQATTITARSGDYAHVTAVGGAIMVEISNNPTAASGVTWIVADGETKLFGPLKDGDKVAIIDL